MSTTCVTYEVDQKPYKMLLGLPVAIGPRLNLLVDADRRVILK